MNSMYILKREFSCMSIFAKNEKKNQKNIIHGLYKYYIKKTSKPNSRNIQIIDLKRFIF